MNLTAPLRKSFTTSPIMAAAAYAGLLIVLLAMIVSSIVDMLDQQAALASSAAMLEQLEGRKAPAPGGRSAEAGMPSGSAFLEGATVTVAGAALLQRVAGTVTKLGGNVL
jgi:general secretion pathway protein M